MAWQAGTTAADYRDPLVNLVEFASSKHVSAAAINAAGTGYIVGDIVTITHAGAVLDCTIEVLTVGGSGEILTSKLRNMGAFSNRIATVAVNVGGTGYVVSDILQIQGGTKTQWGKAQVDTVAGGVITGVSVFEGGGAYSVAPGLTGAATVGVGPAAFAGDDAATLDLTMTGLIGTSGIAATGGTGAGATFDLTLTDTGWLFLRDNHDYTADGVTDEKEIIMQGTVVDGDIPIIGFRSYSDSVSASTDRWGFLMSGFTAFNSALSYDTQPGKGPAVVPGSTGSHVLLLDQAMPFRMSVTGRKMAGDFKTVGASVTSYHSFYIGLMNPYGTATESPYPMFIGGSGAIFNTSVDAAGLSITGITEAIEPAGGVGPCWFRRLSDGAWVVVKNSDNGVVSKSYVLYPVGQPNVIGSSSDPNQIVDVGNMTFFDGICLNTGGVATRLMIPTPDSGGDLFLPIPVTLIQSPDTANGAGNVIGGELDNVFWISGTDDVGAKIVVEDTFMIGSDRYTVFRNAHRTERYSFFAMKEA